MNIVINDYAKIAYPYYISQGMTPQGAVGLMGNQYYESDGFVAGRVEYLCLQRLKENGENYTQQSYVDAVNSGKISKAKFLNPLSHKVYGFGLCQWTTPYPRKSELYDRTVGKGLSIADEQAQLEYTVYELKTRYPSVWKILTTTKSIKTASDTVLRDFEVPDYWESQSQTRHEMAKQYYDYFKSNTSAKGSDVMAITKDQAINDVINVASKEIGYIEKNDDKNLDDPTAGAGYGNYTKYWRDIGLNSWEGQPWCAAFISWCFMKAFGKEMAEKLLRHWPYTYCPTMASLFTLNANPQKGDIVIFYRNGEFVHTGLVISVNGDKFTTIEGNTSGGTSIQADGGRVCRREYYNSNLPGTKFCTPDYSLVKKILSGDNSTTTTPAEKEPDTTVKWQGIVNRNAAKVRTWAGSEYKEVSFSPLSKNTEVGVVYTLKDSKNRDYYYIKYKDKFGFIYGKFVDKKAETPAKSTKYRVEAGTYDTKAKAETKQARLKSMGYESILIPQGKKYIVQVGMFDFQDNANKFRNELLRKNVNATTVRVKV